MVLDPATHGMDGVVFNGPHRAIYIIDGPLFQNCLRQRPFACLCCLSLLLAAHIHIIVVLAGKSAELLEGQDPVPYGGVPYRVLTMINIRGRILNIFNSVA